MYASDAIIALWDGEDAPPLVLADHEGRQSPKRGGAKDVIDLATGDVMPFVRSDPNPRSYAWLPTPVRRINTRTGEVAGDDGNFAHERDAGLHEIRSLQHAAEVEHRADRKLDSLASLMAFIDAGAKDWATKLWRGLLCGSALHFTASLIAAVSAGAQQSLGEWTPPLLAALELTLVSVAIGIMAWAHLKHAQAKWLELRLATELTRALVGAGRLLDPLFPLATDHLPGWRRFCISVGLTVWRDPISQVGEPGDSREQVFEKQKERYLTARIEDQLKHFTVNDPHEKHWWHGVAHIAGPVTAGLAVIFAAIALVHRWDVALHGGSEHHTDFFGSVINYFLPIALPVMAGALLTILRSAETRRRERSYPNIVERLRAARDWLHAIRTPRELRNFVARVEKIFLDELVDWYQTDRRETR